MNTSLSKQGDFGSKLPAMASQATWKAGSAVETGWTVSAHHGGGYAYRMAPADGPLTEETFGKMPLDFVGNSILRWVPPKSRPVFGPSFPGVSTRRPPPVAPPRGCKAAISKRPSLSVRRLPQCIPSAACGSCIFL